MFSCNLRSAYNHIGDTWPHRYLHIQQQKLKIAMPLFLAHCEFAIHCSGTSRTSALALFSLLCICFLSTARQYVLGTELP
ncbi:hypothetical protein K440DRAFT_351952 [Wilcoxina mikolae CBS 423.85]|nr:hypothetical protein K440DRAFT_351952 [Wilcoxina mikolae CBS 423.85]